MDITNIGIFGILFVAVMMIIFVLLAAMYFNWLSKKPVVDNGGVQVKCKGCSLDGQDRFVRMSFSRAFKKHCSICGQGYDIMVCEKCSHAPNSLDHEKCEHCDGKFILFDIGRCRKRFVF